MKVAPFFARSPSYGKNTKKMYICVNLKMKDMEGSSFYHICLRGNNHQDIFYTENDLIQVINRLAIAVNETGTKIVAMCFLHNHFHLVVRTSNKGDFMHYFRMSLTAYFNRQYNCIGNVGTRKYFSRTILPPELDDGTELKDVISYVLRNPLWHGISKDYMRYRWSSFSIYFYKPCEMQYVKGYENLFFWQRGKVLTKGYVMQPNGLISLHSFIDKTIVENLFKSYNDFLSFVNIPTQIELNSLRKEGGKIKYINDKSLSFVRVIDIEISEQILSIAIDNYQKSIPNLSSKEKIDSS